MRNEPYIVSSEMAPLGGARKSAIRPAYVCNAGLSWYGYDGRYLVQRMRSVRIRVAAPRAGGVKLEDAQVEFFHSLPVQAGLDEA